ncbi:MAG TPA: pyruvate kinase [Methanocella sp.]|nr:pyruvate kinase [Methanocella sp.]
MASQSNCIYPWDESLNDLDPDKIERLIESLDGIVLEMKDMERQVGSLAAGVSPTYARSARNLLHYLAVRQNDVRELQERLSALGLSSLGRAESHIMASVLSVLTALYHLRGGGYNAISPGTPPVTYREGRRLLDEHSSALLGPVAVNRSTRIMVTMPSQAADDYELVRDMLDSGMDCVRVNCAHDDEAAWRRMIAHLRRAEREVGKKCKVFMDLAGHKLRTGPIERSGPLIRWKPRKDARGRKQGPAVIWLRPDGAEVLPPLPVDAALPVPGAWLQKVQVGDSIEFEDARGKQRSLKVIAAVGDCRVAESDKGAYVTQDTSLVHVSGHYDSAGSASPAQVTAKEKVVRLRKRDVLVLTEDGEPGRPAECDASGRLIRPATIGITLPGAFARVMPGERIWFDDGKIGGVIRSVARDQAMVEITQAPPNGARLRSEKGINLPDSTLQLPPLTEKDQEDLKFIAKHADVVCFSYVSSAADVRALQSRLKALGGDHLGVVLKIETLEAFEHLPELLLAVMKSPAAGIMIARGDLAVECGYERLAEVQEEILWFCEAAHMPVIWATEVLEKLAKKGLPSRAEITDAAMGVRAECVMLNKGPYILDAVCTLDDILERMQAHQKKKNTMLRPLSLARNLMAE